MRHTDQEIEAAASNAEQWLDDVDPAILAWEGTNDLRAIAEAAEQVTASEARLREAVQTARAHGQSWNRIAVRLGVSRQAARQRYAESEQP